MYCMYMCIYLNLYWCYNLNKIKPTRFCDTMIEHWSTEWVFWPVGNGELSLWRLFKSLWFKRSLMLHDTSNSESPHLFSLFLDILLLATFIVLLDLVFTIVHSSSHLLYWTHSFLEIDSLSSIFQHYSQINIQQIFIRIDYLKIKHWRYFTM